VVLVGVDALLPATVAEVVVGAYVALVQVANNRLGITTVAYVVVVDARARLFRTLMEVRASRWSGSGLGRRGLGAS
jgi:hypothetical protein